MDTIFKEQAQFTVNKIDYHLLPISTKDEIINVTISPVDSITMVRRNLKDVVLNIRRSLKLEPVVVYALEVEVQILIGFVDDCDTSAMTDEDIIQEFKKSCGGLLSTVMSRISVLISTITGANGQTPLITQPIYIES